MVFGARASLGISVSAVGLGFVVGGMLGLVAGYFRGAVDGVLTTLFNVLLSIPALVLALALVAVFASAQQHASNGRKMVVLILALGIVTVPLIGRIARASSMAWSEREFVKAAQVLGAGHVRIMVREVLPNVLPAMVSIALLGVAVIATFLTVLALNYLGDVVRARFDVREAAL